MCNLLISIKSALFGPVRTDPPVPSFPLDPVFSYTHHTRATSAFSYLYGLEGKWVQVRTSVQRYIL